MEIYFETGRVLANNSNYCSKC